MASRGFSTLEKAWSTPLPPMSKESAVQYMAQTIAEALLEEGAKIGREEGALAKSREILLRLLRLKFKRIPPTIRATIQATENLQKLDTWLDEFATAEKLADIHFASRPG
jgi:hypothetical protein